LIEELNLGEPSRVRPSAQAVAIAVILSVIGLAMAAYLVSIRRSTGEDSSSREEIPMHAQAVADNGSSCDARLRGPAEK